MIMTIIIIIIIIIIIVMYFNLYNFSGRKQNIPAKKQHRVSAN